MMEHPEEPKNRDPADSEQAPGASGAAEAAPPSGEGEGPVTVDAGELAALKERAARADEHQDSWMRAMADLQNLQRRLLREKDLARKMAVRDLARGLLPCFDNLERAIASSASGSLDAVVQGVAMVHEEIFRVLKEHGVRVIDPAGDRLDPNLHEAIGSRCEPGVEANVVLDVLERGFALGDLIIRPARVTVATGDSGHEPDGDEQAGKESKDADL